MIARKRKRVDWLVPCSRLLITFGLFLFVLLLTFQNFSIRKTWPAISLIARNVSFELCAYNRTRSGLVRAKNCLYSRRKYNIAKTSTSAKLRTKCTRMNARFLQVRSNNSRVYAPIDVYFGFSKTVGWKINVERSVGFANSTGIILELRFFSPTAENKRTTFRLRYIYKKARRLYIILFCRKLESS